jgi:Xaa-Pro aminopeptidase
MAVDDERQVAIVNALCKSHFDGLVCCDATSVLLLTGFWPVLGTSVVIFAGDGNVALIVPEDEVEIADATTSARITPYKPSKLESLDYPIRALSGPISLAIDSLSLSGKTLGVEFRQTMQPASYASAANFHTSLVDLLDGLRLSLKLVSCDSILESLKARKTTKETFLMRRAADVAAEGFKEAHRCITAGMRETEVAAAAQSAFDTSLTAEGLERSYGFFYCMSGPNSAKAAAAYARTRQRTIQHGDLVMIHANTCADGYWTDITRTYTAGEPTARQDAIRSAISEARAEALNAISPGVAASDVDRAARSVMTKHGFGAAFKHATGHGVGFAAANANGLPRIHPQSPDVLVEGMTFNIEPAAYFDGYGGMRHCDVVAVNSDGATVLTDY